ncbi:hypothetical protein [Desulfocurvus sp.]|jgi:hypothetical protein|uniref:hypothetical protein n=1 Tax=Desulfocurvus sp. TaxID=2871698 RepID=UPI0025B9D106|nr:hypothetical protein [Desulfocurvus sp.]MCK9239859.1 hypothetical protein [Desulfocurvus sp.]
MRISATPLLAAALLALLLGGCSLWQAVAPAPKAAPHPVAYHEHAVRCLALGREYQAQGRHELARETFMHGLAAARDDAMRDTLARELEATDRIILSNR